MKPLDPNILNPGIRETVRWLQEHGFDTTDSGDGKTNVEVGMEHALNVPHVVMQVDDPDRLIDQAYQLLGVLRELGISIEPIASMDAPPAPNITAIFDPVDGVALLQLYNVDDALLASVRGKR